MVDKDEIQKSNEDFIFIPSEQKSFSRLKINRPPFNQKAPYELEDFDKEWGNQTIKKQFNETVSILNKRDLRIGDEVFCILDIKYNPADSAFKSILNRLDGKILAYLNNKHNKILVSASNRRLYDIIRKEIPKYFKDNLNIVKPLTASWEVQEIDNEKQEFLICIVPNIEKDRLQQYIEKLTDYFGKTEDKVDTILNDKGIVQVYTDKATAQSLIDKSTFIYSINTLPKGVATEGNIYKKRSIAKMETEINNFYQNEDLGSVVVMDSGINMIQNIRTIATQDGYTAFGDLNDDYPGDGHGTPISCLIAFGENEETTPISKILSYKIYSPDHVTACYSGMIEAINKYSSITRLFISCIGYPSLADKFLSDLDILIQEKNICVVCSAGNIDISTIKECITNGKQYPTYLKDYSILHPATLINVIATGSITKRESASTIAPINSMAPYSRCGNDNFFLSDCIKPEIVEHGVNLAKTGTNVSEFFPGVKGINKVGEPTNILSGTSFSSPLYMRKLVTIDNRYGKRIKNIETLKAISLINYTKTKEGFEIREPTLILECDDQKALFITEGDLLLNDTTDSKIIKENYNEFKVKVPKGIGKIQLCIVHSDNFKKNVIPSLNSFINIEAFKTGSNSEVKPSIPDAKEKKTNIKHLEYRFKTKSMEAIWKFRITGNTIQPLTPEEKKDLRIRYGCAIMLTQKPNYSDKYSVKERINRMD